MSEASSSPVPATLPDDDDLLREIFVRLPPLPSSLPRASLVCKRWRRLLADPGFLRRFRAHHTTPPLLGFFTSSFSFVPMLSPPDRVPRARFSLPQGSGKGWHFLGCHHGLAAFLDMSRMEAVVWEHVTGSQRRIVFPPGMNINARHNVFHGAVLRAAGDNGNDSYCHLSPFKFVLVFTNDDDKLARACLYESESEKWGNISSIAVPSMPLLLHPSVLIGNALYWNLHLGFVILEFDLDRQGLAIIQKPENARFTDYSSFRVLRTEDRGLGLAIVSTLSIQLWGRKANSNGIGRWVLQKTVELGKLLSLRPSSMEAWPKRILGYDDYSNVIFLLTADIVFMIQLETMQFKKVFEDSWMTRLNAYFPYRSFYTAGLGIDGGDM